MKGQSSHLVAGSLRSFPQDSWARMDLCRKWLRPVKQRMRGNSGETLSSTYSRTVNGRGKPIRHASSQRLESVFPRGSPRASERVWQEWWPSLSRSGFHSRSSRVRPLAVRRALLSGRRRHRASASKAREAVGEPAHPGVVPAGPTPILVRGPLSRATDLRVNTSAYVGHDW